MYTYGKNSKSKAGTQMLLQVFEDVLSVFSEPTLPTCGERMIFLSYYKGF